MSSEGGPRLRARDLVWFGVGVALPLPWVVAAGFGGLGISAIGIAILAGLAILGGAFMLSWSCELAERDIPQSLALLALALVGVLPEYAIDLHFAWRAGDDPSYAAYAAANMTGGNRLLIGMGWTAVVFAACWRTGARELAIDAAQRLEIRFLIWATLYSFLIPLGGSIGWIDSTVLLLLFAAYVRAAMKGETHDVEMVGPALLIEREFEDTGRRAWAIGLFVFATTAIFVSAEPFAESLVTIGRGTDIDEFLLVQWIAPLASESPEFVVAILFAMKLRGSVGIGALVSSKVNQWTLLVSALPIAYSLSRGAVEGLPLDGRQSVELWLTSAQSLFAAVLISNLRFTRREALMLASIFLVQLVFPSEQVRWACLWVYVALAVGWLVFGPAEQRRAFFRLLFARPEPAGS
jgi:cation:H+ antiporter